MSKSYSYLDPDHTYIDLKTGVLRNLLSISDAQALHFVESGVVSKRLQELIEKPIKIQGIDTLFAIHKHLFQDVYAWAGQRRKVEISKGGKQFFPTSHFDTALRYLDSLIVKLKLTPRTDKVALAKMLAEILDTSIIYIPLEKETEGPSESLCGCWL